MTTVPQGYKHTEIGVIPEDWEVANLEKLVIFRNGAAHEDCIDDFGKYVVVNSKFISTEGVVRKGSNECRQPAYQSEILMVMSDVPNGRAIAKCYLVEDDSIYTVNQRICILKSVNMDCRYLFYRLNRNSFFLAFDDGVKQTNLRRQDVLNCPITLPPKQEQTLIATALSDIDALILAQQKLISKKQAIKTATMQQLLTGKTRLPQFALREDGSKKGFKNSELGEVPEDWGVHAVSDLGVVVTGGTPSTEVNEYWNGDIPWITPTDISNERDVFSSERQISNKGLKVLRALPANSVLVTCIASIGKNAILRKYGACNQQINAVIVNNKFNTEFFFYSIELSSIRLKATAGITATLIVSKALFESFLLVFPSNIEEQTAIATILSDMDADIQAHQQRLRKTQHLKQGMMQQLLTGKIRLVKPDKIAAK